MPTADEPWPARWRELTKAECFEPLANAMYTRASGNISLHLLDHSALGSQRVVHGGERATAGHGRSTGGRISRPGPVQALAVPTDEELVIARDTARLIAARPAAPARR